MDEKDTLKYLIHEIKNAAQPIIFNLQFLKKAYDKSPEKNEIEKRLLSKLLVQADKLYEMARNVNLFQKTENDVKRFDLHLMIKEIVDDLQGYINEKGARVKLAFDLQIGAVNQDGFKVQTVIMNLVKNAIEACNEGSEILISTVKTGESIMFSVENAGPKIEEGLRDRVFEPMFTTKEQGSGMGLAISKRFAEHLKGNIDFISNDMKTVFKFDFPEDLEVYEKTSDRRG